MNFNNYIPNDEMSILSNNKEISVLRIIKFEINMDLQHASYEFLISQIDSNFIREFIAGVGMDLSFCEMFKSRLKIGNFITPCQIMKMYQDPINRTVSVSLFCNIDQNVKQFYNKICYLREKQSRFEILDL